MDKGVVFTQTHAMAYYSAVKKNEISPFATTWIDLEDIILSEKVRQRKRYCIISIICGN